MELPPIAAQDTATAVPANEHRSTVSTSDADSDSHSDDGGSTPRAENLASSTSTGQDSAVVTDQSADVPYELSCISQLDESESKPTLDARFNVQGTKDVLDQTGPVQVFVDRKLFGELTAGALRPHCILCSRHDSDDNNTDNMCSAAL